MQQIISFSYLRPRQTKLPLRCKRSFCYRENRMTAAEEAGRSVIHLPPLYGFKDFQEPFHEPSLRRVAPPRVIPAVFAGRPVRKRTSAFFHSAPAITVTFAELAPELCSLLMAVTH